MLASTSILCFAHNNDSVIFVQFIQVLTVSNIFNYLLQNYNNEDGYTKWYVLHAEANAIAKVSGSTQSTKGSTLYITLSPCRECSKLIFQSGITRVVYSKKYKDLSGVEFLIKSGVKVDFIEI